MTWAEFRHHVAGLFATDDSRLYRATRPPAPEPEPELPQFFE